MRFKSLLLGLLTSFFLFSTVPSYALTLILNNQTNSDIQNFWIGDVWSGPIMHFHGKKLGGNKVNALAGTVTDVNFWINGTWETCGAVKFGHVLTAITVQQNRSGIFCTGNF